MLEAILKRIPGVAPTIVMVLELLLVVTVAEPISVVADKMFVIAVAN